MPRLISLFSILLPLVGCSPAAASSPDSHNPAHCIAAFNYARFVANLDTTSKGRHLSTQMTMRALFEMRKIPISDREQAKQEGLSLTERYAADHDAMMALFLACGEAQDKDVAFKEVSPALLRKAQSLPTTP